MPARGCNRRLPEATLGATPGSPEMYEQHVNVTTKHGVMPAFVACPDGQGPFPAIIFYMDAPHLLVDKIKGELYYAFAEHDASVPDHVIPDLRAALAKTDVKNTIKIFPGTHHGFAFPERAVYETVSSEQTWADMFAMWDRH